MDHCGVEPVAHPGDLQPHPHPHGVEIGQRLVEQKDLCVADDRPPDGHALALTAGKLARVRPATGPHQGSLFLERLCRALGDLREDAVHLARIVHEWGEHRQTDFRHRRRRKGIVECKDLGCGGPRWRRPTGWSPPRKPRAARSRCSSTSCSIRRSSARGSCGRAGGAPCLRRAYGTGGRLVAGCAVDGVVSISRQPHRISRGGPFVGVGDHHPALCPGRPGGDHLDGTG